METLSDPSIFMWPPQPSKEASLVTIWSGWAKGMPMLRLTNIVETEILLEDEGEFGDVRVRVMKVM